MPTAGHSEEDITAREDLTTDQPGPPSEVIDPPTQQQNHNSVSRQLPLPCEGKSSKDEECSVSDDELFEVDVAQQNILEDTEIPDDPPEICTDFQNFQSIQENQKVITITRPHAISEEELTWRTE
ncbi:hypothetical protein J6590_065056 [Homalodisca vitripennis]|nr:hypothetical protein J6590_065056 [Homalodisca vitripennis]